MTEDRQVELKKRIEENLTRLSLGDEEEPDKAGSPITAVDEGTEISGGSMGGGSLAEKLGVLQMVDKNEIKDEWKLDLTEIKLEKPVGSGRSGNTYSAWWRGTRVAAKIVDSSQQNSTLGEELLNEFHREVAVVSKLRHPNIVLFLGAAIHPPRYCLGKCIAISNCLSFKNLRHLMTLILYSVRVHGEWNADRLDPFAKGPNRFFPDRERSGNGTNSPVAVCDPISLRAWI